MSQPNTTRLKELLDKEYSWPAHYQFKFLIKAPLLDQMKAILGGEGPHCSFAIKESKKGTYLSITYTAVMQNSDQVLEIYQRVQVIEGILCL